MPKITRESEEKNHSVLRRMVHQKEPRSSPISENIQIETSEILPETHKGALFLEHGKERRRISTVAQNLQYEENDGSRSPERESREGKSAKQEEEMAEVEPLHVLSYSPCAEGKRCSAVSHADVLIARTKKERPYVDSCNVRDVELEGRCRAALVEIHGS